MSKSPSEKIKIEGPNVSAPVRGRGRRVLDQQALMDEICARLAAGESLRKICEDQAMPVQATVFNWLATKPAFVEQYARAREVQAATIFDEMLEIADDGRNDWMQQYDQKTGEALGWRENGEATRRSALRIDARKWVLAKMQPKKYGDKLDVNHGVQDSLADFLETIDGKTRGIPESR